MAKTSFADAAPGASPTEKPAVVTEVTNSTPSNEQPAPAAAEAPADAAAEAAALSTGSGDSTLATTGEDNPDMEGEYGSRDLLYPRLNLVQKSGTLADSFAPGSWVLGKEVSIGSHDVPLRFVALRTKKLYQEQLPYGSSVMPQTFATTEEFKAAGFSLQWGADARVAEIAHILLWIPQPEGVDAPHIFSMESPEGMGTLAGFTAARTAYGSFAKPLINAGFNFLAPAKGGLKAGWWTVTNTLEKKENNSWWLPRIKPAGPTGETLRAFFTSKLGQ